MVNKSVIVKTLFTLLLSSVGTAASVNQDSGTILGCIPPENSLYKGFDVSYYHYPLALRSGSTTCYQYDTTYTTKEYQYGGYVTYGGGLIGKSSGVTNLTFTSNVQSSCSVPTYGKLASIKLQLQSTNTFNKLLHVDHRLLLCTENR